MVFPSRFLSFSSQTALSARNDRCSLHEFRAHASLSIRFPFSVLIGGALAVQVCRGCWHARNGRKRETACPTRLLRASLWNLVPTLVFSPTVSSGRMSSVRATKIAQDLRLFGARVVWFACGMLAKSTRKLESHAAGSHVADSTGVPRTVSKRLNSVAGWWSRF